MGGVRAPDLQQIWLVWGVSGRVGLGCEGRLGAPCKGRGNTKSSKFPMPPMPPTTITRWRVGVGGGLIWLVWWCPSTVRVVRGGASKMGGGESYGSRSGVKGQTCSHHVLLVPGSMDALQPDFQRALSAVFIAFHNDFSGNFQRPGPDHLMLPGPAS